METDPQTEQHMDKSKAHTIPKGITNLENLFDLKDQKTQRLVSLVASMKL
jgi:hypothetical protein